MVHYGPHQALSDATPIARGNTPLTIPILIKDARSPVGRHSKFPFSFQATVTWIGKADDRSRFSGNQSTVLFVTDHFRSLENELI